MSKAGRTIRLATDEDKVAWNTHVNHPLQSWEWGDFRKSMGLKVVRLVVDPGLIAGWQLTFHPIPHTPFTIGYFPKGPLPSKSMLRQLADIGRQKNAIFIQLEPNVRKEDGKKILGVLPLTPSHHPLFTKYNFILDIRPPENDLLKSMHHKTRYNIRVAQKHAITVTEETSEEGFAAYLKLLAETTIRQKFWAHNELYHRRMWQTLSRAGIAKLFTARLGEEVIAAWILFTFHDTIYYPYGTSSREHKETMAPNLLLWEIVHWGKAHGFSYFDLWGALSPNPDPNDPWYGFHHFKEGYRPLAVEYIGSFDLILKPQLYKLYTIADRLRWAVLNRKK